MVNTMSINKAVISKLSRKQFKYNKMRNIFVIIAIVLSSTLFSLVFTSSISMLKGFETQLMRENGSSSHGYFGALSEEEFDKLSKHPSIKSYGLSIPIATLENEALQKRTTLLKYGDSKAAELSNASCYLGKMPELENEVVLDTIVLDHLGLPYELGQKVVLEYDIENQKYVETFILSGISKGDLLTHNSLAWVSKEKVQDKLLFMDLVFKNSFGIERKLVKIILDSGYNYGDIIYKINPAYTMSNLAIDLQTLLMVVLILLVVLFTGYLIIHNVFSLSITKDIRFFGMLKTYGTTPTQIKKIVRKQILYLSIIGIPIGLLIGYLLGVLLLPIIISTTNLNAVSFTLNPWIFILSAVFSFVTVYLGSKKPAKIASKITPIMALQYQRGTTKKSYRKSSNSKVYKIAWHNLMRDKKNAIIIVTTLFLSMIILNSAYTITHGFNYDTYVTLMINSDYSLASNEYYAYDFYPSSDGVSHDMIQAIRSSEMVEDDCEVYLSNLKHQLSDEGMKAYKTYFEATTHLDDMDIIEQYTTRQLDVNAYTYGLNTFGVKKLEIIEGVLDVEKFMTGNYIIVGAFSSEGTSSPYSIGDQVTLVQDEQTKIYEVMAISHLPYSMSTMFYQLGSLDFFLPSNEMENSTVMKYIFDVKPGLENQMDNLLVDLTTKVDTSMDYRSKATFLKEFDGFSKMYLIVGGTVALIVGMIGVANFINSLLTGIMARKKELVILKSIGMTNKQLEAMLMFESLFYGMLSVGLALTLGIGINYLFVQGMAGTIWFFEYHFTLLPILVMSPFILLASAVIPKIANKSLRQISVIDELRMTE